MIPALLTVILLAAALSLSLPFIAPPRRPWSLFLILLIFIPLDGTSIATWIFGAFGVLSLPTLALLTSFIIHKLGGPILFTPGDRKFILLSALITGLLLYPATLGLTGIDPYALGYHSSLLFGLLCTALLIAWFRNAHRLCLLYSLALTASLLGLYESSNILDALLDPFLFLYAALSLLRSPNPQPA